MAKIKVDWYAYPEERIMEAQGFQLAIFDPIPALKYYYSEGNAEFKKCPAFLEAIKNTFVICSPLDIEVKVNKETNQFELLKPERFPKVLVETRIGEEHGAVHPIMSFQILPYLFSSKENVLIELIDPFLEWEERNWRLIPGRFNIGKWKRPISFGFEHKTKIETISIKRGQPITYVRFITPGEHDVIDLQKLEITEAIKKECLENIMLKHIVPNKPLKYIYELREKLTKPKKKCPFTFVKGMFK